MQSPAQSANKEPMVCYSSRRICVEDICAGDICMEDVSHALSLICRAGGHIRHFYSVAQHCLNCAAEAEARGYDAEVQLACLLHDAGEAYLSDVIRPVKRLLSEYIQLERRVDAAVWEAFGLAHLTAGQLALVREVDDAMLHHEFLALRDDLAIFDPAPRCARSPDCAERSPAEVRAELLAYYHRLCEQRAQG